MSTLEKKLEIIHFFVKKEWAMSKIAPEIQSAVHKENAKVLAEIYGDIMRLYN